MFKLIGLALVILALLLIPRSQLTDVKDYQREIYLGSFAYAPREGITDIISLPSETIATGQDLGFGGALATLVDNTPKSCNIENQCVRFVEKMMGRDFNTDAKYIPVNEDQPCEGCAIVTYGGLYGHIAFIIKVESPSMEVIEQNHESCGVISTRSINFEEIKNLKGYVK